MHNAYHADRTGMTKHSHVKDLQVVNDDGVTSRCYPQHVCITTDGLGHLPLHTSASKQLHVSNAMIAVACAAVNCTSNATGRHGVKLFVKCEAGPTSASLVTY